ncbi:MAG: squalene synthetase-like protein [Watsoniomyces obsoletus]|nr:MAG: squalene synthetase-like protein [Watsoniomyces obsoletus]
MPPPPGPGRPGNLTSEQEAKLREFWVALLNVFGIHGEHAEGVNPVAHDEHIAGVERQDTMTSPDKKKKKHLGLFGKSSRKEKDSSGVVSTVDDTTAATTTTTTTTTTNDANDKYGQTKQFKAALASMTPEELRTTFWSMVKHDNPDALLLRFLRARKWDVEKALVMLVSTVHWRAHEAHVDDDVIRVGELGAVEAAKSSENPTSKKEAEDFLAQLRMGKSYLHGVDKDGRPMCIVRVKLHKQGEQSEASLERYTVFVIETARFLLQGGVDTAVRIPYFPSNIDLRVYLIR